MNAAHEKLVIERVTAAARNLADMSHDRRIHALVGAAKLLRDPNGELGKEARAAVGRSSGLSSEMVEWAFEASLSNVTPDSVARVFPVSAEGHRFVPRRLATVVLSANVFSAAVRAIFTPLALGVGVLAKVSTREPEFPAFLKRALTELDPDLSAAFEWGGAESSKEVPQSWLDASDVVSVFGSDETIASIRNRLAPHVTMLGHGHGFGVCVLFADFLRAELERAATLTSGGDSIAPSASAIALDVAAYDQRGCMSPQVVYIVMSEDLVSETTAAAFGSHLARALENLEPVLPRGPLLDGAAIAQLQWRGVAAARGELWEGSSFAVSVGRDAAFRGSPGWRNIDVVTVREDRLREDLHAFGSHLKTVACQGDRTRVSQLLAGTGTAPRLCRLGRMQMPPFEALHDGELPSTGFIKWLDIAQS